MHHVRIPSVFVWLQTGFGKSICYEVLFESECSIVVVVSPLVSLMVDQGASLRFLVKIFHIYPS